MIDPYAPWREDAEVLASRHIGRVEVVAALKKTVRAFLDGGTPNDLYLYGPRGTGKSHLLALVRPEIDAWAAEADVSVCWIAEDIPLLPGADAFLARVAEEQTGPAWMRWGKTPELPSLDGAILLLEGLDRQLRHWKEPERRRLRQRFAELEVLVVATGVALGAPLRERETAFHGHFAPWPLGPLEGGEAKGLLDVVVSEEVSSARWWAGRRDALVALSGGSPRTLVALAESCAERADELASDHLYTVLKAFTAHYQMRFRDLSSQQQQVIDLLAGAPRRVSPSEISEILGISQPAASTALATLVDLGLVLREQKGRRAWFWLAEQLFRHWLEYRTGEWESTRVALLGRVLESLLTTEELVSVWSRPRDPALAEPAKRALQGRPGRAGEAAKELEGRLEAMAEARDGAGAVGVLRMLKDLDVASPELVWLAFRATWGRDDLLKEIEAVLGGDLAPIGAALRFARTCRATASIPAAAVQTLAAELARAPELTRKDWVYAAAMVNMGLLTARQGAGGRGSLPLTDEESRALASAPHIRVKLLRHQHLLPDGVGLTEDRLIRSLGPAPVDAWKLMQEAHRLQFDDLWLAALKASPGLALMLSASLAPERPPPSGDDWIAQSVVYTASTLGSPNWLLPDSLSWLAAWGYAAAAPFRDALDATVACAANGASASLDAPAKTALLAFGRTNPERFALVVSAISEAAPALSGQLQQIAATVEQLKEEAVAELQPELAQLVELLDGAPNSP